MDNNVNIMDTYRGDNLIPTRSGRPYVPSNWAVLYGTDRATGNRVIIYRGIYRDGRDMIAKAPAHDLLATANNSMRVRFTRGGCNNYAYRYDLDSFDRLPPHMRSGEDRDAAVFSILIRHEAIHEAYTYQFTAWDTLDRDPRRANVGNHTSTSRFDHMVFSGC